MKLIVKIMFDISLLKVMKQQQQSLQKVEQLKLQQLKHLQQGHLLLKFQQLVKQLLRKLQKRKQIK